MFKTLKNITLVFASVLLLWGAFALPRRTSFWKTQNPIALPPTQIISWGTVSGSYVSWGTVIANLWDNSSGWVIIDDLYNSSGVAYGWGESVITGLTDTYIPYVDWTGLADSNVKYDGAWYTTFVGAMQTFAWSVYAVISNHAWAAIQSQALGWGRWFFTRVSSDWAYTWVGLYASLEWDDRDLWIHLKSDNTFWYTWDMIKIDHSSWGILEDTMFTVSKMGNIDTKWALFMSNWWGSYKLEVETGMIMFSNMELPYNWPVSRPVSNIAGIWPYPVMINKWFTVYQWEEWESTQMFFANSTGDRWAWLNLDDERDKFEISLNSWWLDQSYVKWEFLWDWRIQVDDDISSIISNDNDFVTKKYVDTNIPTADTIYTADWISSSDRIYYWGGHWIQFKNIDIFDVTAWLSSLNIKDNWNISIKQKWELNLNWVWVWFINIAGYTDIDIVWNNSWDFNVSAYNNILLDASTGMIVDIPDTEFEGEAHYETTGNMGIIDTSFASKYYVDWQLASYIPYTSIDTGFNNTGSDTIIPSEKAVWGLVDWLTTNYIPFWSGDAFYNSNLFMSWTTTKINNNIHLGNTVTYGISWQNNLIIWNQSYIESTASIIVWTQNNINSKYSIVWWDSNIINELSPNWLIQWQNNRISLSSPNSVALWKFARVAHEWSFVFSDGNLWNFFTQKPYSAIFSVEWWFGINTNNPITWWLTVSWDIEMLWDVYMTALPTDWDYPSLLIDTNWKVYQWESCWVYWYTTGTNTTTTSADTRYPITWPFVNDIINCFYTSWDNIVYTGNTKTFAIDEIVSISSDTVQTTVQIWILIDWVLLTWSQIQRYLENTSDIWSITTMWVTELSSWSLVQLVVQSNKAWAVLDITTTAKLKKFY